MLNKFGKKPRDLWAEAVAVERIAALYKNMSKEKPRRPRAGVSAVERVVDLYKDIKLQEQEALLMLDCAIAERVLELLRKETPVDESTWAEIEAELFLARRSEKDLRRHLQQVIDDITGTNASDVELDKCVKYVVNRLHKAIELSLRECREHEGKKFKPGQGGDGDMESK